MASQSSFEETTYPNTPISQHDLAIPSGDFARLTPSNALARLAFSGVVDKVLHDSGLYDHCNSFLAYEQSSDDEGFSEASDMDDKVPKTIRPRRFWKGFYRLNLNILPLHPVVGWVLGSANTDSRTEVPDLLLVGRKGEHRVSSKHARIAFRLENACSMIYAGTRTVSVHGSFGTTRLQNKGRALTEAMSIELGDLQYQFTFMDLDDTTFRHQLNQFMKMELQQVNFELSNSDVFAGGGSCVVAGGLVKETGDLVAVKKINKNHALVSKEIRMLEKLKELPPHPRICRLVEAIYSGSEIKETYIIFEPLMLDDLQNQIGLSNLDDSARLLVCRQCLEGLAWLHENEIMHRDIKPRNMGLKSVKIPEVAIFDFGCATFDKISIDHNSGTISYLAPEILDLKYKTTSRAYNNAVDIWAMGLSLYQIICRQPWQGLSIVMQQGKATGYQLDRLPAVFEKLKAIASTYPTLAVLIQEMLASHSERRPTAAKAYAALANRSVAAQEVFKRQKIHLEK